MPKSLLNLLFDLGLEDYADHVEYAISQGEDFDSVVNKLVDNPPSEDWQSFETV